MWAEGEEQPVDVLLGDVVERGVGGQPPREGADVLIRYASYRKRDRVRSSARVVPQDGRLTDHRLGVLVERPTRGQTRGADCGPESTQLGKRLV